MKNILIVEPETSPRCAVFSPGLEDPAGKGLSLQLCFLVTGVVDSAFHKDHMGNVFAFPVKKNNLSVGNLLYNKQESGDKF